MFTGQQWDGEMGLYYYNARYYNPMTGRFISRDSYLGRDGNLISKNRFIYAENNPLKYVDPTGRYNELTEFFNSAANFTDSFGKRAEKNGAHEFYSELGAYSTLVLTGLENYSATQGKIRDDIKKADEYIIAEADVYIEKAWETVDYQYAEKNLSRIGGEIEESLKPGYLMSEQCKEMKSSKINDWIMSIGPTANAPGWGHEYVYSESDLQYAAHYATILTAIGGGVGLADDGVRILLQRGGGAKVFAEVSKNRLKHIFGKPEHALDDIVEHLGSQQNVYNAVQKAANEALKKGKLSPVTNGILPSGDLGNIVNVSGFKVRLIGGRVVDGEVILSSFSRKGL